jgi:hypothetical protein
MCYAFPCYSEVERSYLQANVLGLCYAQLELDYGYIRALTPFYSVYELSACSSEGWTKVWADKSTAANTVRKYWSPRGTSYTVNLNPLVLL